MPGSGKELKKNYEPVNQQRQPNGEKIIPEPRPKKWNLPLTYLPKISGVQNGTIRQTIRKGRKFKVGDLVRFHGWEGAPYRSGWIYLTKYLPLTKVYDITVFGSKYASPAGYPILWTSPFADNLAHRDGINPPTGIALGELLGKIHGIHPEGLEMQILRW
jgi:hypothetical protein